MYDYQKLLKTVQLEPKTLHAVCGIFGEFEPRTLMPGDALVVWVADVLYRMEFMTDEQRLVLLQRGQRQIRRAGTTREVKPTHSEVFSLSIADCRYAVISGWDRWLDLRAVAWREKPIQPPLQLVTFDIGELYNRRRSLYKDADKTPKRRSKRRVDG